MADSDEVLDSIKENANGPKSVSVDGQTVSQHDLSDQMDIFDRLKEQEAAKRGKSPVKIFKIRPGGTI